MEANRPGATKPTTLPPNQQFELMQRAAWRAGVMGSLNALALVLAARLIVLVAVAGAIALTFSALGHPDSWNTQVVLGVYTSGAVLVSWLVSRK